MNLIDQYLRRSQEIIGDRTESEEQYDNEVIKSLKQGLTIRKAINKANERYPDEALQLDETNVADVAAHYEYLVQHMEILQKMGRPGQRRKPKRRRR
jgi:predicted nucleotidyltransferase